jgi:hypothetical protein
MERIVNAFRTFWYQPLIMRTAILLLAGALMAGSQQVAAHGEEEVRAEAPRVLGEISFPTTAAADEAQQAFIRGMLLLHLFEYELAREEFVRAQQIEAGFAMAYWGEAMTFNHPIWDEQDQPAALAALAKLGATPEDRLALTPDPREQAFLQSLDALYGTGAKAERDRAYLMAMERMAAQFPQDHEVQLFYALALFGVQAGVRDTATYMFCTAIAQSVFSENPHHPGAAHYLIHGVDDPEHAVLGLSRGTGAGQNCSGCRACAAYDFAHLHCAGHVE